MKFTFKTDKPVGKWRAFHNSYHRIKLDGKIVGSITSEDFKIRLKVIKADIMEDKNPNCEWKWITLAKKSANLQEAKDFLIANTKAIVEKYNLYKQDI